MRAASGKHESAWPFSAALRNHCSARRLLRVTPRPRTWQTMLAAGRQVIPLNSRNAVAEDDWAGMICQAQILPAASRDAI